MDRELTTAYEWHRAGRHADAARCCQALLDREPENADALHLFGVLHHECGHTARAAELFARAAALKPDCAVFHANLGEAYRVLGQYEPSARSSRAALELQADLPEAANNLGLALQALGHAEEAERQYRAALRMRPGFALAWNSLGSLLRDQGRLDESLEAFRAASAHDPGLGLACANLGQVLVDLGRAEEAIGHCQQAIRLQPGLAAAHNNLGNAFRALERWPKAHAAYAEAVRLAPDQPRIHSNRGLAFQEAGRLDDALPCLRSAAELAPDDVKLGRDLAQAYVVNENYPAAIACCEHLLTLEAARAKSHSDLGWLLQHEGRLQEAAACYRRALALDPAELDSLLNQGSLFETLGDLAGAEACYRRALAAHPGAPAALTALATLLRGRLTDADRQAIQRRLDEAGLDEQDRANLLFCLAQVRDAHREYAEAASGLEQANALTLLRRRKQGRPYDPFDHSRYVDRLIEAFRPEVFPRLAGMGDDTRQPVFVFGMPRSGTTLVEQVLASHSAILGAGELRLALQAFEAISPLVARGESMVEGLAALDGPRVAELARFYRGGVQAIVDRDRPGSAPERVVDKMPDNYLYLGLLAILLPRATLIHVRRDPRDVALSCWMTNFLDIGWANDPAHIATRFRDHHRIMAHWRAVLPLPIHEVVYERLVDDFESEARRLVAACGLAWDPACLQFHQTAHPVRTASLAQVRTPLYRDSIARWKPYEPLMANLFSRLPDD